MHVSAVQFYLPCNFVPQRLAGDDGDLLTHPLVGVEVTAQTGVVLLDDDPGGLFDGLGPDSPLKRNQTERQLKNMVTQLLPGGISWST